MPQSVELRESRDITYIPVVWWWHCLRVKTFTEVYYHHNWTTLDTVQYSSCMLLMATTLNAMPAVHW